MPKLVRDVMERGVPMCQFGTPIPKVARQMLQLNADAVVVVNEMGEAAGIISRTDVVRHHDHDFWDLEARDVMTTPVATVVPDIPVSAAVQLMLDNKIHQLVILHVRPVPQRPVGMLTMVDVIRHMVQSVDDTLPGPVEA